MLRRSSSARYVLLALLIGALSAPAAAQAPAGSVAGTAADLESGVPLAFSLVRLVALDADGTIRGVVTDSAGRFRFDGLPPGSYRLQLDRIGFEPISSPALRLAANESLSYDLRSRMAPIQLAGITVRAGDTCYPFDRLAEAPELETLWREASKGVETRRQFERQYRWVSHRRQETLLRMRIGRDQRRTVDTLVAHHPDSVRAREERRPVEGYGKRGRTSLTLNLPSEAELLSEAFLDDHCLEDAVERRQGVWGLRFRPVRPRGDRIDVRGVVWVDSATLQVRELELEHLDGRDPISRSTVRYADVAVPGGTVRLPRHVTAHARPNGLLGLQVPSFQMVIEVTGYSGFEQVGGEHDREAAVGR